MSVAQSKKGAGSREAKPLNKPPSKPNHNRRAFPGTSNPRQLRVLSALRKRPLHRCEVDDIAGCSNGPELVAALREKGLELPCERIQFIDRDGRLCRPGVYSLTEADKGKLSRWLTKRRATVVPGLTAMLGLFDGERP